MEFIQHSMAVIIDGVNVCIRIHEIPCECDEILSSEKMESTVSKDEASINHDEDRDQNENGNEEQEDDNDVDEELYDDDMGSEYFFKNRLAGSFNYPESQTSNTCGSQNRNVGQLISPTFVLNNHIEETSITKNEDTRVETTNIDRVDSLEVFDTKRYSPVPCTFDGITDNLQSYSLKTCEDKLLNNPLVQNNPISSLLGPLPTFNISSLDTIGPNIQPMSLDSNLNKLKKKKISSVYICNPPTVSSKSNVPVSKTVANLLI
ncbi:hypothetical protein Tco_1055692 [Tanacetum coccineum]|uniref:Uncharacterized protein n=1 Tax=Tanacetum coccineum TaxID=301880 RepID=A0ABQ5H0E5_9ASTR